MLTSNLLHVLDNAVFCVAEKPLGSAREKPLYIMWPEYQSIHTQ